MNTPSDLKFAEYNSNAPPLNKEQSEAAKEKLIRGFPNISRRRMDQPILNQGVANLSFLLFENPKDGVHGFVKNRGNWPDDKTAQEEAEKIIRNQDSAFVVYQVPVGYWVPITTNEKFASQVVNVDIGKKTDEKQREAEKEKLIQDQKIIKEMKENMERAEDDKSDPYSDTNGLDYYTMRRWGEIQLKQHIEKAQIAVQGYFKSMDKLKAEIKELSKKHPEYSGMWVENLNKSRKERGIQPYTPESESSLV